MAVLLLVWNLFKKCIVVTIHICYTLNPYKCIRHTHVTVCVLTKICAGWLMMSSEKQNSSLTSMCWIRETSGTDCIEPLMPKYAHIFWSASLTFSLGFHFSKKKKSSVNCMTLCVFRLKESVLFQDKTTRVEWLKCTVIGPDISLHRLAEHMSKLSTAIFKNL